MEATKKKFTIQLRVSESEKAQINEMAETANLTVTDFIKKLCFTDGKVMFLDSGGTIAKYLTNIHIILDRELRGKSLTIDVETEILEKLDNVFEQFVELMEKIS